MVLCQCETHCQDVPDWCYYMFLRIGTIFDVTKLFELTRNPQIHGFPWIYKGSVGYLTIFDDNFDPPWIPMDICGFSPITIGLRALHWICGEVEWCKTSSKGYK